MSLVGPVAALAAFLSIWLGHVSVRKIEYVSCTLWLPTVVFIGAGLILEGLSLAVRSLPASAACGIVGITLLWDALELRRQQNRVRTGHAPANPANPRHAAMMNGTQRNAEERGMIY